MTAGDEGDEGLGLLEILYRKMKGKQKATAEKGQRNAEENISEMTNVAQRIQRANEEGGQIRAAQEGALESMFRSFYGIPWDQVALIAGAGLVGLYLLRKD